VPGKRIAFPIRPGWTLPELSDPWTKDCHTESPSRFQDVSLDYFSVLIWYYHTYFGAETYDFCVVCNSIFFLSEKNRAAAARSG